MSSPGNAGTPRARFGGLLTFQALSFTVIS
jgi:hypothetical protein